MSILKDMETPRTISIAEDDIISQQILKTFLAADGYTLEFVDEVGHIRVANQAFRLMLGWRDDQSLIGQSVIGLVARGKRDAFAREIAPLTQKDAEPVSLETVFEPPGSEPFAAEITAGYFEWDTAPSVEILVRDVTEKKRLQSQFLRMQRLQSVGTLAGGIAHDLKDSLTPILLAVHMARAAVKEGPGLKYLETIERAAMRSTDIIKQILAFARGAEGEKRLLQPQYIVRELDKILSQTLPQNIQVSIELPEEDWMVNGDATQLHQVLMNLCVNARDAMPSGGTLSIQMENMTLDASMASRLHVDARAGEYVCLRVKDTGTGIAPEVMEKLFEPFVTTKEVGKGTGLGLSSSLGIVRSHGGFILVESGAGLGTTFSVFVPAVKGTPPGTGTARLERPAQGKGELILVVDDEKDVREMIGETLEQSGYKVILVKEGPEAVALFARQPAEVMLALIDFRMPVLDGVTTARAMRYLRQDARIILLSEVDEKEEMLMASNGLRLGRLVKPFSVEALLRKTAEGLASSV